MVYKKLQNENFDRRALFTGISRPLIFIVFGLSQINQSGSKIKKYKLISMGYQAKNLEFLLLKQKNSKMGQIIGKYRPALMETLGGVMRSKIGLVLKIRIRMMIYIDCCMWEGPQRTPLGPCQGPSIYFPSIIAEKSQQSDSRSIRRQTIPFAVFWKGIDMMFKIA